jgi:hypothetical protein
LNNIRPVKTIHAIRPHNSRLVSSHFHAAAVTGHVDAAKVSVLEDMRF